MGKSERSLINDASERDWEASIQRHPILGAEYVSMLQVWQLLNEGRSASRSEALWFGTIYQRVYGPSRYGAEVLYRRFMQEASRVRKEEDFRLYLGGLATTLRTESRLNPEYNPIDLCRIACATTGSDDLSRRRRIEAMTRFMWARLLHHVDEVDSEIDVGRQAARFMSTVIDSLFEEGRGGDIHVVAILDPRDGYRVRRLFWELDRPPDVPKNIDGVVKAEVLPCRFVRCGERSLPIILDDRVKDDMSRVLKMIRKGERLEKLSDKCGLSIVAPANEELVFAELERIMNVSPFRVATRRQNVEGGRLNVENPDSSQAFKARRLIVEFDDLDDRSALIAEANVQSLTMFFNAVHSRGEENHDFYRLRQLCTAIFPFRYPKWLYGIDWSQGSRHRLHLEERLGLVQM